MDWTAAFAGGNPWSLSWISNEAPPGDGKLVTAEEAALHRVATLVSREASPVKIFAAVAEEACRMVAAETVALLRFEQDGSASVVAQSETPWCSSPAGSRFALDGENLVVEVFRTGQSARVDDWEGATGSFAAVAESVGIRSTVATPVVVEGRSWGAIVAATSLCELLPRDTERRIEQFTDLVAMAIANAEARAKLFQLVDEQETLRRVAMIVAQQTSPEETFAAVAEAVGSLLDAEVAGLSVYNDDGSSTVVAGWSRDGSVVPTGTRLDLGEDGVTARVYHSGAAARIDSYGEGLAARAAMALGLQSTIGAPILVAGKPWGVLGVGVRGDVPMAEGAEERIAAFAELVSTAVSNAQAGGDVHRLIEEQAGLRRVAMLVAQKSSPVDVFVAVTEEVRRVLGSEAAGLLRFEPDGIATLVAQSETPWDPPPLGTQFTLDGDNVVTQVLRTRQAARVDDWTGAGGAVAAMATVLGVRSAVAAPVIVEGRLWGVVIAATSLAEPLSADFDLRLGQFTELVATAISNAEAGAALERLADEQAALRHVATLVARRVAPEMVFRAVAEEAGGLLGADLAALVRLESDNTVTVVAGLPPGPHAPGDRVEVDPGFVVEAVRETGRPARFETDDPAAEGMPDIVRRLGLRSAVASPILVEGALWGAVILGSFGESFAPETEQRLDKFTELVATGISNATARAELVASRARIVAAGDEARRRIERNLHDGTQQRLVSLGLAVRAAEADLPPDRDDIRARLSDVATGLVAAVEDLQEISRGIHPAILSKGGLGPALQTLAHRSAIPVDLDIAVEVRLAEPIEVAAYFVASEALANAAKHSQASRIDVLLEHRDDLLLLSVRDDGIGGADAARGSGLVGLTDRVETLGGSVRVSSRPGDGTQIIAELPFELELMPTSD